MHKHTILVTGGTGFLGKQIIRFLTEKGFNVRVLTRDKSKFKDSMFVSYFTGDILDKESITEALKNCYGLIHAAGEKTNVDRMELINVQGTKNICDIANESDIKYFCHVSSVGVIGLTNKKIVDENTPCIPKNQYEKTKHLAEEYIINNFSKTDCSSVILRPTNVFGINHLTFSNTFYQKIKRWIKGNEYANYVYVKDVASSSVFFLTLNKIYKNDVFIVNDVNEENNFKSIYNIATKNTNAFFAPVILPWLLRFIRNGKNNMGNKIYDSKKLLNAGFKFPFGLKKGIIDALK